MLFKKVAHPYDICLLFSEEYNGDAQIYFAGYAGELGLIQIKYENRKLQVKNQ